MSTEAQIRANRANAELSTGPRSETGKGASSQNRATHRFSSKIFLVLPWERQEEYDELLRDLRATLAPENPLEENLIVTMAQSQWLVRRAVKLQQYTFHSDLAFCEEPKNLALYLRYQTTHERAFDRALKQLQTLRAEKRKLEIGFESQKRAAARDAARDTALTLRAAAENRKQDLHKLNLLLAQARADHQAMLNSNSGAGHPLAFAATDRIIEAEKALRAA